MDITVYLPDEIGGRAKEAGLKFSALLRAAVFGELNRLAAVKSAAEGAEERELELEHPETGHPYTGRIVGTLLGGNGEESVFLTDDERVIVYDSGKLEYWAFDADAEDELAEALGVVFGRDQKQYVDVMDRLGLHAVVDL